MHSLKGSQGGDAAVSVSGQRRGWKPILTYFQASSFIYSERASKRLRIKYHHAVGLMLIGRRHHLDSPLANATAVLHGPHAWEGGWMEEKIDK